MNQAQRILKYLQAHRAMTTFDARRELDIMHPGSRVQDLRDKGHNIIMHRREINGHKNVAEYILMKTNLDAR